MKKILIPLIIVSLSLFSVGCKNTTAPVNTNPNVVTATENKSRSESSNKVSTSSNISSNINTETKAEDMKYNTEGVPVLMYHSVKYEKDNPVRIPKEKFKEQMKYLKDNGYTTLSLDELYDFLENNNPIPKKSVVLTFDDGYKDNYENAYPILKEYGFKATIFMITSCIGTGEYLTLEQLKELQQNGIDIESHTVNHEKLNTLSYENKLSILKASKETLEKLLNKEVKYIAYPYGKYDDSVVRATQASGYKLAVTTKGTWSDKSDGILTLDRVHISGFSDLDNFKLRISTPDYNK